ncbi:MAG: 16S rRNA (uracil(1498)-N(3))-methyltransferase [Thermoguttaceae bacterium]|nr:16S rRNA (uracil(1498)-N(3))-methyltransferase [Thermoguttaceae bacterium]
MSARYYWEEGNGFDSATAILAGDEAHHLIRVMRAKPGDEFLLFDGKGFEYRARATEIGRGSVRLQVVETREICNDPEIELSAAVALPKGDRQKWLIEKLTELGVRRFIPLEVERADIKTDDGVLARLRRQVVEASKQCGRSRFMEILPPMPRREAAAACRKESDCEPLCMLAHPISDGEFGQWSFRDFLSRGFQDGRWTMAKHLFLAVGPVGGFSDREVREAVDDGWPILDLGKEVYRVETAAITAAALFLHLGD